MSRRVTANRVAAAVLLAFIVSGAALGIQGTVNAFYDGGYALGAFLRAL